MYEYACTVLRVLDGDTIEADLDLGFRLRYRAKVRLALIQAPERSTDAGEASAAYLTTLLQGHTVVVRTLKQKEFEKYGRVLGELLVEGRSVNDQLVADGYAAYSKG